MKILVSLTAACVISTVVPVYAQQQSPTWANDVGTIDIVTGVTFCSSIDGAKATMTERLSGFDFPKELGSSSDCEKTDLPTSIKIVGVPRIFSDGITQTGEIVEVKVLNGPNVGQIMFFLN